MFQHLNKLTASVTSPTATCTSPQEEVFAYTVTVGKKTSAAQSYVEDPAAVMDVLSTLIKSAQRDRRTSSACDLATMSLGSQVKQHYLSYRVALFQIEGDKQKCRERSISFCLFFFLSLISKVNRSNTSLIISTSPHLALSRRSLVGPSVDRRIILFFSVQSRRYDSCGVPCTFYFCYNYVDIF